jgi:hypothetical protein
MFRKRGYLGLVATLAMLLASAAGLLLLVNVLGWWFWLALFLVVPVYQTE